MRALHTPPRARGRPWLMQPRSRAAGAAAFAFKTVNFSNAVCSLQKKLIQNFAIAPCFEIITFSSFCSLQKLLQKFAIVPCFKIINFSRVVAVSRKSAEAREPSSQKRLRASTSVISRAGLHAQRRLRASTFVKQPPWKQEGARDLPSQKRLRASTSVTSTAGLLSQRRLRASTFVKQPT